jgi:multisubunit Na+/H+ antiporter MnhG subunit
MTAVIAGLVPLIVGALFVCVAAPGVQWRFRFNDVERPDIADGAKAVMFTVGVLNLALAAAVFITIGATS